MWHIPPDQKVDTNTMAEASFGRNIFETKFTNVLIYKLQRKNSHKPDNQPNLDDTFTEDTLTNLQLLVVLESNNKNDVFVHTILVKHRNTMTWDEDKLSELHFMHRALYVYDHTIKGTWLLDDATVLVTTSNWKEESHTIESTITE
jgi:uncharacterized protein YihD (DUF1040 family)